MQVRNIWSPLLEFKHTWAPLKHAVAPCSAVDPAVDGGAVVTGAPFDDEPPVVEKPAVERFGRYEIIRPIGSGGMAEIFLARQSGTDRLFAIKWIHPSLHAQQSAIELLLDEGNVAVMLKHPNIVRTYDVGCTEGRYFIAMEFLRGEPLITVVKRIITLRRGLPLGHALAIVVRILAALEYAHTLEDFDQSPLQIVHRDVSPHNVFLTYDGAVKLLDFGIAKARSRFSETQSGTLKGKLSYMSPEQFRCEPVDLRSDLFSVGILLWEITTGRRLYKADSEFDVMCRIIDEDAPSPSQFRPGYPVMLEHILKRALDRNADDRYQTAQAFRTDVEDFARRANLDISGDLLGSFMMSLFGHKVSEDELVHANAMLAHALPGVALPADPPEDERTGELLACVIQEPGPGHETSPAVRATPESFDTVLTPIKDAPGVLSSFARRAFLASVVGLVCLVGASVIQRRLAGGEPDRPGTHASSPAQPEAGFATAIRVLDVGVGQTEIELDDAPPAELVVTTGPAIEAEPPAAPAKAAIEEAPAKAKQSTTSLRRATARRKRVGGSARRAP